MLLRIAPWLALITLSCCAGHEKEELTVDDNPTVTPMSDYEDDYDYDNDISITDYSDFPEVEHYSPNKASGTGQLNLLFLLGLALHQIWT